MVAQPSIILTFFLITFFNRIKPKKELRGAEEAAMSGYIKMMMKWRRRRRTRNGEDEEEEWKRKNKNKRK